MPLKPEAKQHVLEMLHEGRSVGSCAEHLGMSKFALWKAIDRDPPFREEVSVARTHGIDTLFEQIPTLVEDMGDAHAARVKLECITKYAAALNRPKYGEKTEIHLNQTVSINHALTLAAGRLQPILLQERQVKEVKDETKDDIDALL